nr:S41 family peptidase [Haliscomenobacter sp.]
MATKISRKPYKFQQKFPPVAVLTGPQTASSGEVVTVAFRKRPNTRSFGEPTAGLSTANQDYALRDSAMILLTVSIYADREKTFGTQITPDEQIVGVDDAELKDPVIEAAKRWLDQVNKKNQANGFGSSRVPLGGKIYQAESLIYQSDNGARQSVISPAHLYQVIKQTHYDSPQMFNAMKTQHQSSTSILVLLALFLSIQGCGLQQRVALDNYHDHVGAHYVNTGINHRDGCPVIDQSRSTF